MIHDLSEIELPERVSSDDETKRHYDDPTGDAATAARLRSAREKKFRSAREFARKTGLKYSVYHSHESGRYALNRVTAQRYAALLEVPVEEITGTRESWLLRPSVVSIVGTISEPSARVTTMPDGGIIGDFEYGPLSPDIYVVAFVVVGDGLKPFLRDGYKLLAEPMSSSFDPSEMHDRICFYRLSDGLTSLAELTLQPNGLFTINQFKGASLYDQKILEATRVRAIIPK